MDIDVHTERKEEKERIVCMNHVEYPSRQTNRKITRLNRNRERKEEKERIVGLNHRIHK
jgi:hypothetical protein